jgi:transcription elongation factor Elf1
MTCEECGSQEVKRTVDGDIATLHCKECGWERDYKIKANGGIR